MVTAMPRESDFHSSSIILLLCLGSLLFVAPCFFGLVHSYSQMIFCGFLFLLTLFNLKAVNSILELPLLSVYLFLGSLFLMGLETVFLWRLKQIAFEKMLLMLATSCLFLQIFGCSFGQSKYLMLPIVLVSLFQIVYGAWQLFHQAEWVFWQKKVVQIEYLTGTYLNRNHVSAMINMGFFVLLGIFFKSFFEKRFFRVFLSFNGLFVLLLGIWMTGSRMGLFSLVVTAFFMMLWFPDKFPKARSVLWGIVILLGIFFSFLLLNGFEAGLNLRWLELQEKVSGWDGGRIQVWKDTCNLLKENTWTGIGLGAFRWSFPMVQSANLVLGWDYAHQSYLELALEIGIPVFVCFISGYVKMLEVCFQGLKSDFIEVFYLWGILTAALTFIIHSLADFQFSIFANVLIFHALLALSLRLSKQLGHD